MRSVLGISEAASGALPDHKPVGSIGSRLDQIANRAVAACELIFASLCEVLDDRFWDDRP